MPLLYEKHGAIAVLTLSRPQARNAWGEDYNAALKELLPQLEDDPAIRCVILTGDEAGGAFSAGANIKDPKTHTSDSIADAIEALPKRRRFQAMNLLSDFAKPLVAAVNGYAIGIGCIVTYCCDLIVASERAEWRLTQVSLGILPAQGGTVRLARWVGRGQAMKLALGFPLKAEEAYRAGLAQWVVPHDELMGKAMEVAEHLAALPPLAARLAKEAVAFGLDGTLREAANADLYRFMALELTEDKKEAHQAWRERRKPALKGGNPGARQNTGHGRLHPPLALVTGASGGIGGAVARELARHGHDLVLAARGVAAMEALAGELREGGAAATVIAADLAKPGAAATLADEIARRGLAIDILVNNAGLGAAGRFDRGDPARIGEMLLVNIVALTELTRLLLPGMIARAHGRVMLVASVAGFQPGPHMAAYFASKAYVLSLGEALAYELRGTGVSVTVLCPGATATNFFTTAGNGNSLMARHLRRMMPAEDVARVGYRGLAAGRGVVITGTMNWLVAQAGCFMPHRITLPVTDLLMRGD